MSILNATYTRDKHKKPRNRKWLDGTIEIQGGKAVLKDAESLKQVAFAPSSVLSTFGGEELESFGQGILVLVDGCSTTRHECAQTPAKSKSFGGIRSFQIQSSFENLNAGDNKSLAQPCSNKQLHYERTDDEVLALLENNVAAPHPPLAKVPKLSERGHIHNTSVRTVSHFVQNGDTAAGFVFPIVSQIPKRHATIPDSFSSVNSYIESWTKALTEEVNLKISEIARRFFAVCKDNDVLTDEKLSKGGIRFHSHCDFMVWQSKQANSSELCSYTLVIKENRGKSTDYHKDDLWILSNQPRLESSSPDSWIILCRSIWHGPNKDGKVAVEIVGNQIPDGLRRCQSVVALQGPEVSHELAMLAQLRDSSGISNLPLLDLIVGLKRRGVANMDRVANSKTVMKDRFRLNKEQAQVFDDIASWETGVPNITLIHGPFGTGKSSLLVSLILYILEERTNPESSLYKARILVSAHTNVAVDRILLGLKSSECLEFLRVGSLRRINRELFGQCLHCSDSKVALGAAEELKEMLKEASSPVETAFLQAELSRVEKGAEQQRRKRLKTIPIVGVTCCSAQLSVLDDNHFDVVVLDECSQMIEPLSLMPILRSKAKYLVAAGDPCQLPPVISSPAQVSSPAPNGHGLLRPLFVRLSNVGWNPHLLRVQYRCAPNISDIPNRFFYQGRLLDGCSSKDRYSLVPGLGNVSCIDVKGREDYSAGKSVSNAAEVAAVVPLVCQIKEAGVSLDRIGIITFYRAQAAAIKAALSHDIKDVQVATVDSFQGAEKDVIILSTAVTRPGAFASETCRLNVALTRAKHNLIIVGCAPALKQSSPALAELLTTKCNV